MTSKACFSKPAGFFRQLTAKQLWLFALWSVFLLFLYPLSGMMEFSDGWEYTALYDLQRQVDRSFLTRTTAVLYMMPVLAIVFSSCFGYLNSRQKLDFYHAQPVTRTRLFFTNYASGAFHFVVPYMVMHTLAFVLMNSVTGFYQPELRLLLYPMLYTLGMFFIFYSLMVLFRMVCGNTVIAVLSYGFMTNLPAIAYFLYQVYVGRWSNLYMSSAATESGMRLTPYTLLGSPMSVKVEPSGAYAFVTDIDWTALVVWVVAALAAAAGAVLLYKVRPSEKAGSAVAVRGVLPVIKYPLVVCASLLAFVVLYNLTNININERIREIATIKVLGFYQSETAAYVFREITMLSVLGSLAGLVMGKLLHAYVMAQVQVDGMFFPHRVAPTSYLSALVMTWLFTLIITFVMRPKLRRIDMAESLKSIE